MQRHYTMSLRKGLTQMLYYLACNHEVETTKNAFREMQYTSEEKTYSLKGDSIEVTENTYGLNVFHHDGLKADSFTFDNASDLILNIRYALERDHHATCYGFKLKEGWTRIDADNMENDEVIIVDDYFDRVYEIEVTDRDDRDDIKAIGCVTTTEDARLVKGWCEEENMGLTCNGFEEGFYLEDFLQKTTCDDFWADHIAEEVQL